MHIHRRWTNEPVHVWARPDWAQKLYDMGTHGSLVHGPLQVVLPWLVRFRRLLGARDGKDWTMKVRHVISIAEGTEDGKTTLRGELWTDGKMRHAVEFECWGLNSIEFYRQEVAERLGRVLGKPVLGELEP
jgi:hypothetical protein